jgi:hypothetical protein
MADYTYIRNIELVQRESQYGRWVEPWFARCTSCGKVMGQVEPKESADSFLFRLTKHELHCDDDAIHRRKD